MLRRFSFAVTLVVVAVVLLGAAAASQAAPGSLRILVVGNELSGLNAGLVPAIAASPGVAAVDTFDSSTGTPSPQTLAGYDLVVGTGDTSYQDPALWGNGLADFLDAGGAEIQFAYDNWDSIGAHPTGRFESGGYPPFIPGPNDNMATTLGTILVPNSPLLAGVPSFSTSDNTTPMLAAGATLLAKWADGRNAIAVKGRVESVSAHPDNSLSPISAAAQLVVNAGNVLGRHVLSVSTTGTGAGVVTSNTGGINCGTTCAAAYPYISSVTLTATASSGSSFAGWGGACAGTQPTCVLSVDAAKNATANFTALPPPPTSGSASIQFLSSTVTIHLKTGKGSTRVTCANVAADVCKVKLTLTAYDPAKKRRVKIGTATGTISGGQTGKLKFKLTSRGLALLKQAHHHKLKVTAKGTSKNRAGQATAIKRRLTLKGKR